MKKITFILLLTLMIIGCGGGKEIEKKEMKMKNGMWFYNHKPFTGKAQKKYTGTNTNSEELILKDGQVIEIKTYNEDGILDLTLKNPKKVEKYVYISTRSPSLKLKDIKSDEKNLKFMGMRIVREAIVYNSDGKEINECSNPYYLTLFNPSDSELQKKWIVLKQQYYDYLNKKSDRSMELVNEINITSDQIKEVENSIKKYGIGGYVNGVKYVSLGSLLQARIKSLDDYKKGMKELDVLKEKMNDLNSTFEYEKIYMFVF